MTVSSVWPIDFHYHSQAQATLPQATAV